MGKVRDHIPNDAAALTQWAYRKLVNHDPMTKRESSETRGGRSLRFQHVEGSNTVRYTLSDGRVFEMKVVQVAGAERQGVRQLSD